MSTSSIIPVFRHFRSSLIIHTSKVDIAKAAVCLAPMRETTVLGSPYAPAAVTMSTNVNGESGLICHTASSLIHRYGGGP